jgi:Tol biopolymer transport system component
VRRPTFVVTSTLLLVAASPAAIAATTELVSITSAGQQANGNSYDPSVSADGSRVGFRSVAANLGGDGLTFRVYVRDRLTLQTIAADTGLGGAPPDGDSSVPLLSRDGSRVVFSSFATNLVPGDTNDRADVFEHDLTTGTTVRITVTSGGIQANGGSSRPDAVSANGRYVLFESTARNLTHGPKSLGCVFVRDVLKRKTLMVGLGLGGVLPKGSSDGKSISGDGRFVGLESDATNLVAGDSNGASDVFVVDRRTGATLRASVSSTGEQGNGGSYGGYVSDDGSVVAFQTNATNLASSSPRGGIMVRDLKAGTTVRVDRATDGGEPNGPTGLRGISANGRFVLMFSLATNLVTGDSNNASDLFVYDRQLGKISRVDLAADGSEANLGANESSFPSISPDGSVVGFDSASTNLVPGGTNGLNLAFVRLLTPTPPRGLATRMR